MSYVQKKILFRLTYNHLVILHGNYKKNGENGYLKGRNFGGNLIWQLAKSA